LKVFADSSIQINMNTIFRVQSAGSRVRYFANIRVDVVIGSYRFRNPPNFMQHDELTVRDAEYEVDALLQHLLYHQNTAPFVADLLIKRFVTSNPSPAYVEFVADAFMNGVCEGFGSGKYGDMAATVAAVLLYRDALSTTLKSDGFHGKVREPVLKIIHILRALEIKSSYDQEIQLENLALLVSQEAYRAPNVFNFYVSEFQPSGSVANAGLYTPESKLFNAQTLISYMNAMSTLIQFGFTSAAYQLSQLVDIDVPSWSPYSQPCRKFGVLSTLSALRDSYNMNETAVISSIGTLVEPITLQEFKTNSKRIPIGLQGHNIQTLEVNTMNAASLDAKGVLGRLDDILSSKSQTVGSYVLDGAHSIALEGKLGISEGQFIINAARGGIRGEDGNSRIPLFDNIRNLTEYLQIFGTI
jgi:hypothetical protein